VAALTRRELRTPPDHGAPVFVVAIMVASAGLSWVFSGARGMWSAQPAIKIWCAACVSQGASRAAQGAIRPIRRVAEGDPISFKQDRAFLFLRGHGRGINFLFRRLFSIDLKRL
jgi:hypothetical protein